MTAPAQTRETRSAYPVPCPDLLPQARVLAESMGEIPSRNRIMSELRIGAPKATWLRDQLAATPGQASEPDPDPAQPVDEPGTGSDLVPVPELPAEVTDHGHPDPKPSPEPAPARAKPLPVWPVLLLAAPAFVAIWAGWVDLGRLTGFGSVRILPGIADDVVLDIAITLPIGMESYAAYALWVWLSGRAPRRARVWAQVSAIAALTVGAAGQVAYHLMAAAGWTSAPWPVTAVVACLPVAVLGMGAALAHLLRAET